MMWWEMDMIGNPAVITVIIVVVSSIWLKLKGESDDDEE